MPNLTAVTDNLYATIDEVYSNNLSSTILALATTVPVNSVGSYANDDQVVITVEPGTTNQATFTGTVSGSAFINCIWTEGNLAVGHSSGKTVVDYDSATHTAMLIKAVAKEHNPDGTHGNIHADSIMAPLATITSLSVDNLTVSGAGISGYSPLGHALSSATYLGTRSYSLVFTGVDVTNALSAGMRLQTVRTVSAPVQCTFLNGSTQFFTKSSPTNMTFTDDFVVSAWIKPSSYNGATQTIAARYNGTSGWRLQMNSSGQISLEGFNAGSANFSGVYTVQSVSVGEWTHVTAQLDMSSFTATATTSYIMLDGGTVPVTVARGGTNPTALVQAGNLEVGSQNSGTSLFGGRLAQVAIYNAKVTQTNIRATISQSLSGTETSLISAYSFNNTLSDLNATGNNLTASGSADATSADAPWGTQANGTISATLDYAIVHSAAFSTNSTVVVQVPKGCTIPTTGGVVSINYSSSAVPYAFPKQADRWRLSSILNVTLATTSNAAFGSFQSGGWALNVPVGAWTVGWMGQCNSASTTTVYFNISPSDLTGLTAAQGALTSRFQAPVVSPTGTVTIQIHIRAPRNNTGASTYVMYTFGATVNAGIDANSTCEIFAENAYL